MTLDPIVEEVRGFRDAIAREHGYDIASIFEALRKMEVASGREHVSLPPRANAQQAAATDETGPASQPITTTLGSPRE